MTTMILPGVYIQVRDDALITTGAIVSGYVGVVGTATQGPTGETRILGSVADTEELYGAGDLPDAVRHIFNNGASTVYAVRAADGTSAAFRTALQALESEVVNIIHLAGQDTANADMVTELQAHLVTTAQNKRERIAVIASKPGDVTTVAAHTLDSDRLVLVAPGISGDSSWANLAAAVTGTIAALPVHHSPTNKVLQIRGLTSSYSPSELENLVQARVLAVEQRHGYRIVKGITTATNSAWHQITTRRIVDHAVYGVRASCNPYIGRLNNERVRGAMKATLDGFLTRMVADEALTGYQLEVTATRPQEIAGEAVVTMTIQPTFSIDFVKVTMYLG